ncbi:thioredoxin domain-containing protein [uncultured Clostridium sp.]|uniref:thioredoxin domain-containing protein n=1 Tax=uncultured Clostridium sp. TaxID=59620 RepID=UPI00261BC96D|nr:thioredoxin domain-containing protein [uncultured Clostridium sp.]
MFGNNSYEKDVEVFTKISSTEAESLLSKEELAVIYIGRATCPYCRKFAKKLSALASDISSTIYYVNSEDYNDAGIDSLRAKYNVRTVPGFIVRKNGEIEVRCDSSLPEDEILNLVK